MERHIDGQRSMSRRPNNSYDQYVKYKRNADANQKYADIEKAKIQKLDEQIKAQEQILSASKTILSDLESKIDFDFHIAQENYFDFVNKDKIYEQKIKQIKRIIDTNINGWSTLVNHFWKEQSSLDQNEKNILNLVEKIPSIISQNLEIQKQQKNKKLVARKKRNLFSN